MKENIKQYHSKKMFTANEIKPAGWLKKQLRIQADSLSGNLDKMWPDIRDSRWIGGDRDGWERVPYWLDGFIPLAWLLDDDDLKARAKKYMDAIMDGQKADGWICPCEDKDRWHYDMWAAILIAKVLTVYADCSKDKRAETAVYKVMQNLAHHLKGTTLFNWGAARGFEAMIALNWLMEKNTEPWMKELAITIKSQSTDYEYVFDNWKDQMPKAEWRFQTHVVNMGMALKSAAVYYRVENRDGNAKAKKMLRLLEKYHGMAVDHFSGDECLAGTSPIHGTELCGVVEAMYSYEVLFSITGDEFWLKKLEKLAYNALPATISKDMWTHQYLQMTNQTVCRKFDISPVFYTNGPEANLFGLEPNFGCCTANFNQGWPKLALSAFMKEGEDTIISCVTLPSELKTTISGTVVSVKLETDYPFREKLCYSITASEPVKFKLKIHVPENCRSVHINGKPSQITDGFTEVCDVFKDTVTLNVLFDFEVAVKKWPHGLYSVERGPLVYSLPIKSKSTPIEYERDGVERKFPYCDYEIRPETDWNYAFAGKDFEAKEQSMPQDFPFSEKQPPVVLETEMVKINWGHEQNYEDLCAEYPKSKKPIGSVEKKLLVPYGCTVLRMTEMPFSQPK